MRTNPLIWIGLAGVDANDNPRAQLWQQRLQTVMIGVALLAVPAYVLDSSDWTTALQESARVLDVIVFLAFLAETVWMVRISSQPVQYLVANWLNLVILMGSLASALGAGSTEWVPLVRLMRVALGSLLLIGTLAQLRVLFTRRGAPLLVGVACLVLLGSGGVFYWIEPTVHSYWDGVWLAFVTGTTVGYGDLVPTTGPARVFAVLITIVGVSLMTLFTANVVTRFLRHDDPPAASDLSEAVTALRQETARLAGIDRVAGGHPLEQELRELRAEIAALRGHVDRMQPPGPPSSSA